MGSMGLLGTSVYGVPSRYDCRPYTPASCACLLCHLHAMVRRRVCLELEECEQRCRLRVTAFSTCTRSRSPAYQHSRTLWVYAAVGILMSQFGHVTSFEEAKMTSLLGSNYTYLRETLMSKGRATHANAFYIRPCECFSDTFLPSHVHRISCV